MTDYASIRAIECQFIQHTDEQHRQAHHKLNAQYAGALTDVSDATTALSGQEDVPRSSKPRQLKACQMSLKHNKSFEFCSIDP